MIDQLPPAPGFSESRQAPTSPRQRGASFQDWLADREAPAERPADLAAAHNEAEAAPDTEATQSRIELHVRDAHGNKELVSVPWGLAAANHLAQEWASVVLMPASENTMDSHARSGPIPVLADDRAGAASVAHALVPAIAGTATSNYPMHTNGASGAAATDKGSATGTAASAAAPLAARLVRWIEQFDHASTAWIRDYRLDDEAARALVETVRQMAREQGFQLDRIVINAREMWRAPSIQPNAEKGQCR